MKNWKLKQELNALKSEYGIWDSTLHTLSRTDAGGKEYFIVRSSTDIIEHAISYIE